MKKILLAAIISLSCLMPSLAGTLIVYANSGEYVYEDVEYYPERSGDEKVAFRRKDRSFIYISAHCQWSYFE